MTDEAPDIAHDRYDFVEGQLARVGDRDPLEILRHTPGEVAAMLGRADQERIHRPWAPGKWTPAEILAHLALTEWVFGFRTRTVLCDPDPVLQPVEQELWLARAGLAVGEVVDHLQDFAALRRANLRIWCRLTDAERERTGLHAEAGVPMTLGFLLRLLAGHDLNHLEQIGTGLSREGGPGED
ncbi:MAG: DinB family protein [Longimicrobiales bacterium]